MDQEGTPRAPAKPPPSDPDAVRMFKVVYEELRGLARLLRSRHPSETLQPTALVHEAFVRLAQAPAIAWTSQGHFKAIAAQAMRHILLDRARRRCAEKRGGHWARVTLSGIQEHALDCDLEALDGVFAELEQLDPRAARLVEMRVFGGMTHEEIGVELGLAARTVRKDWRIARAWLLTRLPAPR